MTVLTSYADMRNQFATSLTLAVDGYPVWPVEDVSEVLIEPYEEYGFETPAQLAVPLESGDACLWHLIQPASLTGQERWYLIEGANGSAEMELTAFGDSEQTALLAATGSIERVRDRMLRGVYVYVKDTGMSSPNIFVFDAHRSGFASATI